MSGGGTGSRAEAAFAAAFGGAPDLVVQAPGRVNLIGEHTDYNDGFVLPCAIDSGTVIAARRRSDAVLAAVAADFGEEDRIALDSPIARAGGWRDYVRGVAEVLRREGLARGAEVAIAGDVPQGAGLSSSASLEVALATTLARLQGLELGPTRIALLAQKAENDFVGCACGIMDQLVSARAGEGQALLIDCRSLDCRPVPMPEGLAVIVIHSGIERGLVDGAYNERRRQCEAAARHYGVAALRDLDEEALLAGRKGLDPVAFRRARHVVTENARTLAAAEALASGDLPRLGLLMAQSHASMRDDFEITLPAIDRLAEIAAEAIGGEGGARMTGGGFGGCIVALAPQALVERVREAVERGYRSPDDRPARFMVCRASAGAGPV
ncbi:MAG: galactokinase [Alphaproteobacteria bacterium]|nr:MAG: galactokinase [Alphaproteobacteria bacterium]